VLLEDFSDTSFMGHLKWVELCIWRKSQSYAIERSRGVHSPFAKESYSPVAEGLSASSSGKAASQTFFRLCIQS
jgi:hypothetical protein